jgi:hypothetical protein
LPGEKSRSESHEGVSPVFDAAIRAFAPVFDALWRNAERRSRIARRSMQATGFAATTERLEQPQSISSSQGSSCGLRESHRSRHRRLSTVGRERHVTPLLEHDPEKLQTFRT